MGLFWVLLTITWPKLFYPGCHIPPFHHLHHQFQDPCQDPWNYWLGGSWIWLWLSVGYLDLLGRGFLSTMALASHIISAHCIMSSICLPLGRLPFKICFSFLFLQVKASSRFSLKSPQCWIGLCLVLFSSIVVSEG